MDHLRQRDGGYLRVFFTQPGAVERPILLSHFAVVDPGFFLGGYCWRIHAPAEAPLGQDSPTVLCAAQHHKLSLWDDIRHLHLLRVTATPTPEYLGPRDGVASRLALSGLCFNTPSEVQKSGDYFPALLLIG